MENFVNSFPAKIEPQSYVYGIFLKESRGTQLLSFLKEDGSLRPIGGTLRDHDSSWFNHEEYMTKLSWLLQALRNKDGTMFYTQMDQEKILDYERKKDVDRGDVAPYFRTLVYHWLRKTGLYPCTLVYIGHIPGQGGSLTKHLFHVLECMTFRGNQTMYLSALSREPYQFDNNFYREGGEYIRMFDLPYVTNNIYAGQYNAYYLLLQKFIVEYQQKIGPQYREQRDKYIKFLISTQ